MPAMQQQEKRKDNSRLESVACGACITLTTFPNHVRMNAKSQMERLVKPTWIYARAALTQAGETLSHTDTMKTLNSEPRIEINWTPGGWAGYAYAAPTLKADDFNLALAMAELASVAAERDTARQGLRAAEAERDKARQSLRAAEQDAAETESVNSDLRTVNARLVADLAAAVQRANTAEAILRAKA